MTNTILACEMLLKVSQWSLRLLADKVIELGYCEHISHTYIKDIKNNPSPIPYTTPKPVQITTLSYFDNTIGFLFKDLENKVIRKPGHLAPLVPKRSDYSR